MYSQYSYYQPQQQHYHGGGGGGGETTVMTTSSTTYEQPAVNVSSDNSGAPYGNSTSYQYNSNYSHSQPQQQQSLSWNQYQPQQQQQQQQPHPQQTNAPAPAPPAPPAPPNEEAHASSSDPKALVEQYSRYYQYWTSQASQEAHAAATLYGQEKDEAVRREAWARYYAEQSSRSAHHYNNIVQQQQQQVSAPRPPPQATTPEKNQGQSPSRGTRTSRWGESLRKNDPVVDTRTAPPSGDESLPEGLKQYAHRCLSRCNNGQQKELIQQSLESVIAKAIRDGTMHSTDWDRKELLPLPNSADPQSKFSNGSLLHQLSQSSNSPSANGWQKSRDNFQPMQEKRMADDYDSRLPENDSYFGSQPSPGNKKRPADDYISLLPENDSYFGSQANSSPSNKKKKQKKNNASAPAKKKKQKKNNVGAGAKAVSENSNNSGFERSHSTLAKRADRFSGRGGIMDAASSSQSDAGANFGKFMGKSVIGGSKKQLDDIDYEQMTVKGTCKKLEKEYLRLTAPPRAEAVRPQPVLEEHMRNLKKLWGQRDGDDNNGTEGAGGTKRDYVWFCSQLKAVRQDLTVQRINNAFAVDVYETHARIGLEMSDLNEYNQCQTQLKELYELLLHDPEVKEAEEKGEKTGLENYCEFVGYRIIYYVFLMGNKKYDGGSSDLFKIMLGLSQEQRKNPCIAHALKVRVAVAEYDYHSFFRLQESCPKMGAYLMDYIVPAVRQAALQRICRAYRPSVETLYLLSELGFEADATNEVQQGKEWLQSCGCKLSDDGAKVLTKESAVRESDLNPTKSSLI